MCGCECCIYTKSMNSSLLSWRERFLKKLKDQSCNAQSRRSGEMYTCLFDTYKNNVVTHGDHMFQTAYYMEMATVCAYP